MYDEDERGDDDDELEDIMEESIEEESEDSDGIDNTIDTNKINSYVANPTANFVDFGGLCDVVCTAGRFWWHHSDYCHQRTGHSQSVRLLHGVVLCGLGIALDIVAHRGLFHPTQTVNHPTQPLKNAAHGGL